MSLLIDFVILALLGGVLAYAYLVDRRVRQLVQVLRELEPMVDDFSAAVDKSEDSISAMKAMTQSISARASEAAAARQASRDDKPAPRAETPSGVSSVNGKTELVRSFFETVRSRQA